MGDKLRRGSFVLSVLQETALALTLQFLIVPIAINTSFFIISHFQVLFTIWDKIIQLYSCFVVLNSQVSSFCRCFIAFRYEDPSVCLPVFLSFRPSFYPSVRPSIYPSIHPCVSFSRLFKNKADDLLSCRIEHVQVWTIISSSSRCASQEERI